jgi:hypothetical protein
MQADSPHPSYSGRFTQLYCCFADLSSAGTKYSVYRAAKFKFFLSMKRKKRVGSLQIA